MVTALIFAIVMGGLYLLFRPVRRFVAVGTGNSDIAPKEKIWFALPIIVTLAFVGGWLSDPAITRAFSCYQLGTFNAPCVLGLK